VFPQKRALFWREPLGAHNGGGKFFSPPPAGGGGPLFPTKFCGLVFLKTAAPLFPRGFLGDNLCAGNLKGPPSPGFFRGSPPRKTFLKIGPLKVYRLGGLTLLEGLQFGWTGWALRIFGKIFNTSGIFNSIPQIP